MRAITETLIPGARRLLQDGGDFLYPPACLWCQRQLNQIDEQGIQLCGACRDLLAPERPLRCHRCSAPIGPHLDADAPCVHCRREVLHFRQAISLGTYDEALRRACIQCKQASQRPLATALTRLLCLRSDSRLRAWNPNLILPVPHHWTERFVHPNPSTEAIAEALGAYLSVPMDRHLLSKRRRTKRQHDLPASQRRRNLQGAFQVCRGATLAGLNILLVDDVLTTGTTVNRNIRELQTAGAENVHVAVLARCLLT